MVKRKRVMLGVLNPRRHQTELVNLDSNILVTDVQDQGKSVSLKQTYVQKQEAATIPAVQDI
ncbi:hypothetical protein MOO45_05825 [Bombilactobacillus folatiphilus]|uniref:Uncharacterized protein n=1 Tax=Bombilactobacillus folatiphilus TaxID=2923362 RepID=A0ABY4P7Y0_9LACO|nr:hypothetical protein [Bombilactobacillus folatiphilus]UQS81719.1 hypothetical protein MOO45_05825 [Bombilactobacillus folatiphilus]